MDNLIKGFLGVFFLLLISFLGLSLVHASMNARDADTFLSASAKQISNSNYAPTVIETCKEEARQKGYRLSMETVQPKDRDRPVYGKLKLRYDFTVPILSFREERVIEEDLG